MLGLPEPDADLRVFVTYMFDCFPCINMTLLCIILLQFLKMHLISSGVFFEIVMYYTKGNGQANGPYRDKTFLF